MLKTISAECVMANILDRYGKINMSELPRALNHIKRYIQTRFDNHYVEVDQNSITAAFDYNYRVFFESYMDKNNPVLQKTNEERFPQQLQDLNQGLDRLVLGAIKRAIRTAPIEEPAYSPV